MSTQNSVLAKMAVKISADSAEFGKVMNKTHGELTKFTNQIRNVAGALGVAFSVQQVASFSFEIAKLAGEAEGVSAAFSRLPNSVKLMEDMKRATGGTVSELELMKRAVQASNFDISLSALPRLLEFATLRAQQTGQSVDYLVDSIVTGIGRKSKLILDNLGISAVQLNEALGGVTTGVASIGEVADAVGKIAESNLKNMAGFSDNAATKVQRLNTSWADLKVTLGDLINNSGLPGWLDSVKSVLDQVNQAITKGATTEGLQAQIEMFNRMQPSGQAFLQLMGRIEEDAKKLGVSLVTLKDEATGVFKVFIDERTKPRVIEDVSKETQKGVMTLESLKEKQKELNELFELTDLNDSKKLNNIANEIIATQKLIDKYEALRKAKDVKNFPTDTPSNAQFSNTGLGVTAPINPFAALSGKKAINSDWTEHSRKTLQAYQDELYKTAAVAEEVGGILGSAFSGALTGQQSFIASLSQITGQIIQLYLKQSIAAMIAASIKDPTKPLPIMKIAGAALGIAAVNALFSSIGRSGGGGSGSSGGIGGRGTSDTPSSNTNLTARDFNERIELGGTIEIAGDKLLVFIRNAEQKSGSRRG